MTRPLLLDLFCGAGGAAPPCAEVDLLPAGRALARRVRVTTLGHFRCLDSLCGLCRVEEVLS